ncbi:hypothetical protein [Sulfurisphaera tokodaii]|uniref:DNA alkylation repair enzyme n=2 Tax=Sulfurisphaera tokodaii TaxID=111955 RepID=Q970H1_SULTO|nr:hypothetical protein STK_16230 [Sulfurisphaera tokodaii str. 7]HII73477.1 hypothetical protein [Sulfurisphaera tokodaii]
MDEVEKIDDILRRKHEILRNLRSPDKSIRDEAWRLITYIVDTGNGKYLEDSLGYLRSLLWNKLQGVRDEAWSHLPVYKALLVQGIDRALTADSDRIKWSAWSHVLEMIQLGIVEKDKVIEVRYSYWRLLKSRWATIRKKAWNLFVELVKENIFQPKDKERYIDFLKHKKASVRIYAWEVSSQLVNLNFITKDELLQNIQFLQELTQKESNVKKRALKVLKRLES